MMWKSTTKWFRGLLGAKKTSDSSPVSSGSDSRPPKEKKRWGVVRSFNANDRRIGGTTGSSAVAASSGKCVEVVDANKHAIAVAAATAAVAEAALAAAHAAAEVVRLTSSGSRPATAHFSGSDRWRESAAVKIQSAFRAYLARRALRALKSLVKLQALVRGHIVRRQSADMLRRMQAMARIQARVCSNRAYMSESSYSNSKFSQPHHQGLKNTKKNDHQFRAYSSTNLDGPSILKRCSSTSNIKDIVYLEKTHLKSNWLDHWMEECPWDSHKDTSLNTKVVNDENSDKILEVDTWNPLLKPQRCKSSFQTSKHVSAWNYNDQAFTTMDSLSRHSVQSKEQNPRLSSTEIPSLRSLNFPTEAEAAAAWTAMNSPRVYSALSRPGSSARRGPFTPSRSECSQVFFNGYSSHPNYMANTESSRAKFRSQSAPRQRMQLEKGSVNRFVRGYWDADANSERGVDLHANFRTGAYPGSSNLDRLQMPVQSDAASLKSVYGSRF